MDDLGCEIAVGRLTYHKGHQPTWYVRCNEPAVAVMHGGHVVGRRRVCEAHRQELDYERFGENGGFARPRFSPISETNTGGCSGDILCGCAFHTLVRGRLREARK